MRINSENPPTTYVGMWEAICTYAETDELTRTVLVNAHNESLDHVQTLISLAYVALCSREIVTDTNESLNESSSACSDKLQEILDGRS